MGRREGKDGERCCILLGTKYHIGLNFHGCLISQKYFSKKF